MLISVRVRGKGEGVMNDPPGETTPGWGALKKKEKGEGHGKKGKRPSVLSVCQWRKGISR